MRNLKHKAIYELLEDLDNLTYYLYKHNKNYTKKQYYSITDICDIIEELKERI